MSLKNLAEEIYNIYKETEDRIIQLGIKYFNENRKLQDAFEFYHKGDKHTVIGGYLFQAGNIDLYIVYRVLSTGWLLKPGEALTFREDSIINLLERQSKELSEKIFSWEKYELF
jgi:hypothetical protein